MLTLDGPRKLFSTFLHNSQKLSGDFLNSEGINGFLVIPGFLVFFALGAQRTQAEKVSSPSPMYGIIHPGLISQPFVAQLHQYFHFSLALPFLPLPPSLSSPFLLLWAAGINLHDGRSMLPRWAMLALTAESLVHYVL